LRQDTSLLQRGGLCVNSGCGGICQKTVNHK
jgi:hypothetical protein